MAPIRGVAARAMQGGTDKTDCPSHPSRLRPLRAGRRRGRGENPSILECGRSSTELLREPIPAPMLIILFTRLS